MDGRVAEEGLTQESSFCSGSSEYWCLSSVCILLMEMCSDAKAKGQHPEGNLAEKKTAFTSAC